MTKNMKAVIEAVKEVSIKNSISELDAISLMQAQASKNNETALLGLLTEYKDVKYIQPLFN